MIGVPGLYDVRHMHAFELALSEHALRMLSNSAAKGPKKPPRLLSSCTASTASRHRALGAAQVDARRRRHVAQGQQLRREPRGQHVQLRRHPARRRARPSSMLAASMCRADCVCWPWGRQA